MRFVACRLFDRTSFTNCYRTNFSASRHDNPRRPRFRDYRSHTDPYRKALTCTDKEILLKHCVIIHITIINSKHCINSYKQYIDREIVSYQNAQRPFLFLHSMRNPRFARVYAPPWKRTSEKSIIGITVLTLDVGPRPLGLCVLDLALDRLVTKPSGNIFKIRPANVCVSRP